MAGNMYGTPRQTYAVGNTVVYPADGNGLVPNVAPIDVQALVDQGCISEAQWLNVQAAHRTGGGISRLTVSISSPQLLAVGDSPPVLVPAPGTNKFILVLACELIYTRGSHLYDGLRGLGIGYQGGPASEGTLASIAGDGSASVIPDFRWRIPSR